MEFDETNVQVVMKQVKAKNPTIESDKEWNNLQLVMSVFVEKQTCSLPIVS